MSFVLAPIALTDELTLIEARPSAEVLRNLEVLGALDAFPKAHVFNADGFLLGTITGYPRPSEDPFFYEELQRLLALSNTLEQHLDDQLADAAAYWRLSDSGEPMGTLPEADYYLVERYADWCNPCRRFMQDFPGWVADHEPDVVLIKLDLMPAEPDQDSPSDE